MVCKEDVVTWFKELTSHKRIDVMCTLLNMCLPFELRFLGTCLEDLGKRDFHEFRDVENRANNVSELSDLQCISDKRTQRKLALYLALLHSCNHACSNGLFKILTDFDFGEINNITNNTSDENPLDELLLLYTLALNHPAFTYEQRAEFGNILVKLQEEESKLYAARHSVGIGLVYVKNPIQACIPCPTSDEQGQLGPCTGITIPHTHLGEGKLRSPCPCPCPLPPPAAPAPALPPPGLVPAPGAGPEPLTFLHLAYPSPAAAAQGVGVPWGAHAHHAPTGLMMPVAAPAATLVTSGGEEQSGAGGASASPASPLTSRQASPQQSASPSRAASPAERPAHHYAFKSSSGQRRDLPLDGLQATRDRDREREREGLRDALGKELPSFAHSLQHYSAEELKRMGDEDLRELGLPPSAVMQLRSLVGKLQGTNGLTSLAPHSRPKPPRPEEQHSATEVDRRRPLLAAGPCFACFVPAPSAAPAPAPAARFLPSPAAPCGPAVCCASHGLRALRLDERPAPAAALSAAPAALGALGARGTSSSDSSAGPSPPDTPHAPAAALPLAHWHHGDLHDKEKGTEDCSRETTTAAASSGSGACAPATSTAAAPASCAASYGHSSSSSSSSCSSGGSSSGSTCSLSGGCGGGGGAGSGRGGGRPPGLARGKAAGGPPGVQTVARGRGPAPGAAPGAAAVAPANERPGARRPPASISASTAATADPSGAAPPQLNGAPPPRLPPPPPQSQQQQDDRTKVFLVSGEAFGGGAPLPFAPAPSAPASPAPFGPLHAPHFAPHHPHPHPHHLRSSSLFPSFAAATYMRPFSFASPNGELVYGFHPAGPPPPPPPQTPPPPPPQQAAGSAPASASAPVSAPGAPQAAQTPPTTAPAAGTGFVAAFAPQVPPPKLSCYNCGSHQHHGADCKDPTMEDMTKPGQYRLDFSPYAKGPGGGGNAPGGGELPSADK